MYLHEPDGYSCVFCGIIRKAESGATALNDPVSDVIYHTESATAFLSLSRWKNNPVDVLVVPNQHYENIYDLPLRFAPEIHQLGRAVALSLKGVYECDGTSTRQHNEPAGDQDVWHYHVHVTPRFLNDGFYRSDRVPFPQQERLEHARRLCHYMNENRFNLFLEKLS